MAKLEALVEVEMEVDGALSRFMAASASFDSAHQQVAEVLPADIAGEVTFRPTAKPIPMFAAAPDAGVASNLAALTAFATTDTSADVASASQVVAVQADETALDDLRARPGVRVWPNSAITFFVDCRPFAPAVTIEDIRDRLGVHEAWESGHRGDGIIVGVIDEGIDGTEYPVIGGFNRIGGQVPGAAAIESHGSMCAADVLVAAPDVKFYDYPFLVPRSSSALAMFSSVLEQRRLDGTPHVVSNSWGFVAVPPRESDPTNEIWDIDHPLHRKIREVITSGAPVVFAAGNCGTPCPSGNCRQSSIGPGISIHGSNSLEEVITVAAVNHSGERIGYSSQGPGMFEREKPDVAAYSHFFGNFGPGRPGGEVDSPFDNGTSAACPVTSGVLAMMLSNMPDATPDQLRTALLDGAGNEPWSPDTGHGIINAARSLASLTGVATG
jgi:serine protease AprX